MRLPFVCIIAGFAMMTRDTIPCAAQEVVVVAPNVGISARHHSWGRFQAGAWKTVRVVTETIGDNGVVASANVTETKTRLKRTDPDGVVLEVQVGVEVAGKQFDAQPQNLKQGYHGELAGGDVKIKAPCPGQVTVEDRKIDCQMQQVEIVTPASRTVANVFYSDHVSPYILRRQSTTTDPATASVLSETVSEVIALNMPQRVLADTKTVACVKTVQKTARGSVTTLAMTSAEVPGGVVYQTTKETDTAGRLVRRSTLELVNYGARPEEERTGLFGRKRPPRRKTKA